MVAVFDQQACSGGDVIFFSFAVLVRNDHLAAFNSHLACILGSDGGIIQGSKRVAALNVSFFCSNNCPPFRNFIFLADHFAVFNPDSPLFIIDIVYDNPGNAIDLGDNGLAFGCTAGFKKLLHTGQTGCNVTAGSNTAGVECAQCQLGTRLTNGLGCYNTHCRSHFHQYTAAKVGSVAGRANAMNQLACHRRTYFNGFNTGGRNLARQLMVEHIVVLSKHFTGIRVHNPFSHQAAVNTGCEGLPGNIIFAADGYAFMGAAVFFINNDILGNIHQAAGQVPGICCTQGCISQAFTGTVGGDEVFKGGQPFAEVRLDGQADNTTGRVCHQTTHSRKLRDRTKAAFGSAGVCHGGQVAGWIHCLADCIGNILGGILPDINDFLVALLLSKQPAPPVAVEDFHFCLGICQDGGFLFRNGDICHGDS